MNRRQFLKGMGVVTLATLTPDTLARYLKQNKDKITIFTQNDAYPDGSPSRQHYGDLWFGNGVKVWDGEKWQPINLTVDVRY